MKFVKENKRSKEWRTMKITVDFENGMQVTLSPENIHLLDNPGQGVVLAFKTEHTAVPIVFFKNQMATPAELKAREEKAAAKVAVEAAQKAELVKAAAAEIEKRRSAEDAAAKVAAEAAAESAPVITDVPTTSI
jgi:hypothetical protein